MSVPVPPSDGGPDAPSIARIYDCLLGGSHNHESDRRTVQAILRINPGIRELARANRAFLRRAVTHLVRLGVDQFLDLGAGIPTVDPVHEVAQALNPAARVVYVDRDPVAVEEARRLLAGNPLATMVDADVREAGRVLTAPELRTVLDLSRPVAVLMLALLHFVPDREDPRGMVAGYRDGTVPGSYLVITHAGEARRGGRNREREQLASAYSPTGAQGAIRSLDEVAALFAGYELLEPGIVDARGWPDLGTDREPGGGTDREPGGGTADEMVVWAGVGRRP